MTFRSRLGNALSKAGIIQTSSYSSQYSKPGTAPINLNGLKTAFSEVVSQPVWGPEISTVGAYSREGYSTKTFETPTVPFSEQVVAMKKDEDVGLAMNHLSSIITGGQHYWKGASDSMTEYIEEFSNDIDFDWFDTILVKELLAYGNSVWMAPGGIQNVRSFQDFIHIPISSFVRIWKDRRRRPYKYEFRGPEWQGYHNPQDIIHFKWNPIDGSEFGTGFLTSLTSSRDFEEITVNGPVQKQLPSMLDRKYSTMLTMHLAERRYISRNIYQAIDADDEERAVLQADLKNLEVGEDFVVGKKLEVQEMGSQQRDFDPAKFTDVTMGSIFKALNDFRGKQGSDESSQYANAESSALLDEIGLASFPFAVSRQLIDNIFKPWYVMNPIYDLSYGGGFVGIPWDDCKYELNFGHVKKSDIELADAIKLLEIGISSGSITDPIEIRDIIEQNGLQIRKEYTDQLLQQQNQMAMNPYGMGAPTFPQIPVQQPEFNANVNAGAPPMSNGIYDDMMRNPRPTVMRLNFTDSSKKKGG